MLISLCCKVRCLIFNGLLVLNTHSVVGRSVLITGAARRIGAEMARILHAAGMNIILHYHASEQEAQALAKQLQALRANSVHLLQADLLRVSLIDVAAKAYQYWGQLDVLVNNASTFYPTPITEVTEEKWEDLLGTNLKAPFFLSQACAPYLAQVGGSIINMVDIHAQQPLKGFPVYSVAKAGLLMLTKALARELGPQVRVNAIAPGPILWPEQPQAMSGSDKEALIERTALKRQGEPADIAKTALFLIREGGYITGQIIAVDGGRSLGCF